MKQRLKGTKAGFTLVELSFAIAFISVLLITITLITNEIVSIYRKGYSIKTVNQVGRDIIDDFQDAITQSSLTSISSFCQRTYPGGNENCEKDGGFRSVYQQYYTQFKVANSEADDKYRPTGGIFCSGKYTYIWNTGYLFNNEGVYTDFTGGATPSSLRIKLKYHVTPGVEDPDNTKFSEGKFRLLKVEDNSRSICAAALTVHQEGANSYPAFSIPMHPLSNAITITEPLASAPKELLKDSDAALALYDFVLFDPARVTSTGRLLLSGSFILGTITGGVDIMTSSNFCKAPTNFSADFNYCAINKFNFTIQASGNK